MENKLKAAARLLEVMDTLREKCPWDREQTFESLRNNTIEETYELVDAIAEGNMEGIKEELGDLLLHVVFYSKLGEEEGKFNFADVADAECDKLIYRPTEVMQNWEELKLRKKKRQGGILGGVPRSLPAMVKAFRVGEKAASSGFDWEQKEDVWAKVKEEIAEIEVEMAAGNHERTADEIGDLFFALINMCRLYGIDPELALEKTNKKFISRFQHMEAEAGDRLFSEMTAEELDVLWRNAKREE